MQLSREQMAHAIAIMAGHAPAGFTLAPQHDYRFLEHQLTAGLILLSARQDLNDSQSAVTQSDIGLIKNLGGGWNKKQQDRP